MNLSVIGTGYVGLVTAVCFAELGHNVVGVDNNEEKIKRLRQGIPPIYEPGIEELLRRNMEQGRLRFTGEIAEGVAASTVLFICVGTPQNEDGSADLSQVENVTRVIAENMRDYRLLVEKSTVPVHTSRWIERTVRLYNRRGVEFDVASNPEFLREGSAIGDFMNPDRIVVGVSSDRAAQILLELYSHFDCPKIVTDANTAEIIKHASNSFLAMKISFINMIANLCEQADADVQTVAEGMGLDKRIGRAFLNAGLGYGGYCFPKDVKAFIRIGEDLGVNMDLLKEVDSLNLSRIENILAKVRRALWVVREKDIAILGLAFKPNTDDIRGAPAIELAQRLLAEGARLRLYDPQAMANTQRVLPPSDRVFYAHSPQEAVSGAQALIVATEWEEFKSLDLRQLNKWMTTPILIDGRNIFSPADAEAAGFEYFPVGRKPIEPVGVFGNRRVGVFGNRPSNVNNELNELTDLMTTDH
jgi:UDPglucose 6-dehydrogenase